MLSYPGTRVTCLDALTYAAHPDTASYVAGLAPERYRFVRADIGSPVAAQTIAEDMAASADGSIDIVVTGSSIRGVAPVGSNLVSVGQEAILKVAPTSVSVSWIDV